MTKKATGKGKLVRDTAMNRRMWHSIAESCPFECWIGVGDNAPVKDTLRARIDANGWIYFWHDAFKALNSEGVFKVWWPSRDETPEYRYKKDKIAFYKLEE